MQKTNVVDYAISSAVNSATESFTQIIHNLANELAQAKSHAKQLQAKLNTLKSKAKTQPLPSGFAYSSELKNVIAVHTAESAALDKRKQAELSKWHDEQLHFYLSKYKRLNSEMQYKKSLEGSYAQATAAINARKADIRSNGDDAIFNSGEVAKGLLIHDESDNASFFSFETFPDTTFSIKGQEYQVVSHSISSIGAGNTYNIVPIYQNHSRR